MATLRNKRKLAALKKENCEEHPRSNLAQNSNVPRSQEDYITQVFEEIEGRVTKRLSQEFSRTENRILGARAGLDDFFMNPLVQGHSGTTPETSQNALSTSQGTNEDDSQSDPHPEAGIFHNQMTHNARPKDNHDMVTGFREEVTYCSPSTSSGKQKKNRSTSQPQFLSENILATIESGQILLALQQLANNNNFVNSHSKINNISKLPKSLTTTMPTFDGKFEKFELFGDLFQTRLKIHNQLTEDDRFNYFHSLMTGDALQTFENINGPTRENLGEILAVFRRKYVKAKSMEIAKHKLQELVFNPAIQKLVDFLNELQKLAQDAFGIAAHAILEQFIYAKMLPHLKKSLSQAHLENGTYELIVTHLERQLELNDLEAPEELQINTVSQQATNTNANRPKPTCYHCKKTRTLEKSVSLVEKTTRTN